MDTHPAKPIDLTRLALGTDPVRRALYIAGMAPAVWYFYLGLTNQLGADPQNALERALGLWALRFLVASLAVSPLRPLVGPRLIRYRRTVGLLAFYYAMLHVAVYLVLDQGLNVTAILGDIATKPYITVGLISFAILVPLAVTSNNASIRRLGARWNKLHTLAYLAAVLGALHFILLVKVWPTEPLIYAALVAGLLLFRLQAHLRKRFGANPANRRR